MHINREDSNLKRRDCRAKPSGGQLSKERVKPAERAGADRQMCDSASV